MVGRYESTIHAFQFSNITGFYTTQVESLRDLCWANDLMLTWGYFLYPTDEKMTKQI